MSEVKVPLKRIDETIEEIIDYMGIDKKDLNRITYKNLVSFMMGLRGYSGLSWQSEIKPKLRIQVGLSFKTLDEYFLAVQAFGVFELVDGKLFWKGLPKRTAQQIVGAPKEGDKPQ